MGEARKVGRIISWVLHVLITRANEGGPREIPDGIIRAGRMSDVNLATCRPARRTIRGRLVGGKFSI